MRGAGPHFHFAQFLSQKIGKSSRKHFFDFWIFKKDPENFKNVFILNFLNVRIWSFCRNFEISIFLISKQNRFLFRP